MKTTLLLAIDDKPDNLYVLRSLIGQHLPDCDVVTALSAKEGFTALAEIEPDGIVIDVQMPEMGGIEMCRLLKADEKTAHVPVILITAHGAEGVLRAKGLDAGADDFVCKPINNDELVARVRVMLRIKEVEDELRKANALLETQVEERTQSLKESEELKHQILDAAGEGIYGLDKQGNTTFINPAGANMIGWKAEVLMGKAQHEILHHTRADGSPYPREECHIYAAFTDGKTHTVNDEVFWRKDGTSFPVEYTSTPVFEDDKLAGAVVVFRDISERKKAEEKLHQFKHIVSSSTDMLALLDKHFVYLAVNEVYLRAFNKLPEELIGQTVAEVFGEEFFSSVIKPNAEICMAGEEARYQNWFEFPATGRKCMDIIYSPHLGPEQEVLGFAVTGRDITEQKQNEEELEQHRTHLGELVDERTEQLAEALTKADTANQAKSTFLANMSHEIRTPMNAITGLTHLMQQADTTPEQAQRLEKIGTSTQHLLSIINNILDISKIEAGKLVLENKDFHLDALFDNVHTLFTEQIRSKGLAFETATNDISHWLRGDPTRVSQVLINYVGNAIKFTERGSIHLRARIEEENDKGMLVRFEVTDTGVGIASDKITPLFEAFEQADVSTTRKHGGTGLGLAINRRLAELMRGEVGAESKLGKGSTFWFTARLARGQGIPETSAPQSTESGLLPRHHGARILLVEDNAINLEVAMALLSGAGLATDTAENGQEAVDKVCANDYDLVLMDIQMPEMDGLEATRLIRAIEGKENLPILAMTANVFEEDRRACLEVGMRDFVAKPIEVDAMFNTLAKWLPAHEANDQVKTPGD